MEPSELLVALRAQRSDVPHEASGPERERKQHEGHARQENGLHTAGSTPARAAGETSPSDRMIHRLYFDQKVHPAEMPLLSASRVSMHYSGPLLLDGVTLSVEPGRRVGVIGPNGAGKSTLLKILAGTIEPTAGGVTRQRGTTVAYQAQELHIEPGRTVYEQMDAVFSGERRRAARIEELEARIAAGENDLLKEHEELSRDRVYDIDRRIETMLSSLGLAEETWHRPVEEFSGGERNILGLAGVLLADPDVLLLDEPSNHLDMDGVEWFINFLRRSRASVVMVSHNRHLLDATCHEIWEQRRGKVTVWTGNYSDYQRQKEEAVALQERQYKNQQRLIERIQFRRGG